MASLNTLTAALSNSPHDFIQSTSTLHAASLLVAKQFLDPLAASVATSKNGRRRGSSRDTLFLDQIYLEGFDIEQVWEQVRLLVGEVEGSIGASTALKNATTAEAVPALVTNGKKRKAAQFDSDEEALSGKEVYSDFEDVEDGEGKLGDDPELDGEEVESSEDGDLGGEMSSEDAEGIKVHDDDLEGLEALEKDDDSEEDEEPTETFVEDVHGLNDGFFSIDHFNRQSEMFEQMDLNGDVNESDEEIDYNADPDQILITAGKGDGIDDEGDREEDDFDEDLDENGNANEIMYTDFFALPPKKWLSKTQLKKNAWKNEVPKRDLFDDAFSEGESEGDQGDPANRKSAYERRQLALSEQIRKLELENVSKKKWTLTGEARATQRHLNSLLEEDLDFERIGKPVPVITQEVTETIEDMIKRRVLAGEFDELQKRRPTDVLSGLRRGRMELDDSKPQASLAEAYEKDLLQSVDPVGHPNPKDKKLQKEYEDISLMFADVTKKLDSLSSWHYTPKPPKPSISIVSDAPAIAMEEAQPTVGGGGAAAADASMLAPQEVYNPVKDRKEAPKVSGVKEIVGKSGAPVSVAEMTSEEKQKRRKQNKEKQRKKSAAEGQTHGGKAKEGSKKDVMDTLQNGGVKVIGKGGGKTDVHGKEVKEKKGFSTSNAFKL
ncbi:Mpp10 protein [Terfezia boudieri ATCC MYA-4762]|uniref:U3 small nucleolar ribonucleoprotein protein MPP10 n=1 Tax=Terfezia boudieri ATCC MYA-4762 TaxID=1051890 RepID=A0A3N4M0D6_9PEZI|nr:Mpp10 protein [Terfezia boudieri ATCC MYA-4762]